MDTNLFFRFPTRIPLAALSAPSTSNQITGLAEDRNAFISTSTIAVRGSIQNLEAGHVQAE